MELLEERSIEKKEERRGEGRKEQEGRDYLWEFWTEVPPRTTRMPELSLELLNSYTLSASSYVAPPTMNMITSVGLCSVRVLFFYPPLLFPFFPLFPLPSPLSPLPSIPSAPSLLVTLLVWAVRWWRGRWSPSTCSWRSDQGSRSGVACVASRCLWYPTQHTFIKKCTIVNTYNII